MSAIQAPDLVWIVLGQFTDGPITYQDTDAAIPVGYRSSRGDIFIGAPDCNMNFIPLGQTPLAAGRHYVLIKQGARFTHSVGGTEVAGTIDKDTWIQVPPGVSFCLKEGTKVWLQAMNGTRIGPFKLEGDTYLSFA